MCDSSFKVFCCFFFQVFHNWSISLSISLEYFNYISIYNVIELTLAKLSCFHEHYYRQHAVFSSISGWSQTPKRDTFAHATWAIFRRAHPHLAMCTAGNSRNLLPPQHRSPPASRPEIATHRHSLRLPSGSSGEEPAHQSGRRGRCRLDPWVRKMPWRRAWQPTPAPCLGSPVDRGAWRPAAAPRVAESGTQLERPRTHARSHSPDLVPTVPGCRLLNSHTECFMYLLKGNNYV